MLATTLRRHGSNGPFDQLEQCLLYPFPGDIAGDGGIVRLAGDLVDLVDVDDATLGLFYVVVALLQQLLDDVLHVLAHVTCFGQGGRIGHGERHIQQTSQSLGQQGFTATGRANQQNVGFAELHTTVFAAVAQTLVVVVDGNGQHLLGILLPDHIVIEMSADLMRGRQLVTIALGRDLADLFADDVVAQLDALITYVDGRASDQLAHFMLAFAAKRAVEQLITLTLAFFCHSATSFYQ